MKLLVVSHKPCWPSTGSSSGYATDGGFPFQMRALSELFSETTVAVPCSSSPDRPGEVPLAGQGLSVAPLTTPLGHGWMRKAGLPFWLLRNGVPLLREIWRADAVHTPVPGDIGTVGMVLAVLLRKRLFVRHCGNWERQETAAERFLRWFIEHCAGGRNVMLATGASANPPSRRNPNVRWVFATSLTHEELRACAIKRIPPSESYARLIHVGRQDWRKGTEVVLRSLPLLQDDFSHVTLDVIGDGPALPRFRTLAAQLGVSSRVSFHGQVTHEKVLSLLQQADIFCFPTESSEGFPKAVLEALACGLPVITTPVSVLPRLVGDRCGVILDSSTPEAVAEAVGGILRDRERYLSMSTQAQDTASEYSLERWRDTIGALLGLAWGKRAQDRC